MYTRLILLSYVFIIDFALTSLVEAPYLFFFFETNGTTSRAPGTNFYKEWNLPWEKIERRR